MRPSKAILSGLLLAASLGPSIAAQNPGDLVFTHFNVGTGTNVLTAPPGQLGNFTTLHRSGGNGIFAIHVDHGNGAVLAARYPQSLLRLTPGAGATTVSPLPRPTSPQRKIVRDQDGSVLMTHYTSTPNEASIIRVDHTQNSVTTLTSLSRAIFRALCRDDATANIMAITDSNELLRINRATGGLTSVATLPGSGADYEGLCYMPDRDLFAVSIGGRSSTIIGQLGFMTRTGTILSKVPFTAAEGRAYCLTYDERAGVIHCGTSTGHIVTWSSTGTRIRSHDYGDHHVPAIDVWDDRRVSIRTSGQPGTNLEIRLGFTQSGGQAYGIAFSGGLRPGIKIGGQHLHAALDAIFFATVSQLPGFTGTLPANGQKTVNFRIPALPAGLIFFVTAFAQNAALPGGFDIGNTECFRIE